MLLQESVISRLRGQVSVKLIVTSPEDNASMNIRARLLECATWQECGSFESNPVLRKGDFHMIQVTWIHTLSVHPIGNDSSADFGGRPGILCPTAPNLMTSAMRNLKRNAEGLEWDVSFETTHHGPLVNSPVFYIEIGSYEELWERKDAAEAIAEAIPGSKD